MNEKSKSLEIEKQDLQAELKKLKLVKIITHTKEDVKNLLLSMVYIDISTSLGLLP